MHTYLLVERGKWLPPEKIKWKCKSSYAVTDRGSYGYDKKIDSVLKVSRPGLKEMTKEQNFYSEENSSIMQAVTDNYTNKHRKKHPRSLGPMSPDRDLTSLMFDDLYAVQFYGTEESATTNIISENEAYITYSTAQTGFLERFGRVDQVNVTSSLCRVYDRHITTDADHVYINQTITETAQNAFIEDWQTVYKTDYTATFKNGRCITETEKIETKEERRTSEWMLEYLKSIGFIDSVTVVSKAQDKLALFKRSKSFGQHVHE